MRGSILALVSALTLISGADIGANLVLYYSFDEQADLVEDLSETQLDGTVRGDPKWTGGISGDAIHFDGIDDNVLFAVEEGQEPFGHAAFTVKTVALWFKASDVTGEHTLYDEGGFRKGFLIQINGGKLLFATSEIDNDAFVVSTSFSATNKWHFVAAVFDNGKQTLYLDTAQVDSGSANYGGVGDHANAAGIGATCDANPLKEHAAPHAEEPSQFFDGIIDEVRVWERALSHEEVIEEYWLHAAVKAEGKLAVTWGQVKD